MKTQLFHFAFPLICLAFPLTTTAQVVDIPDPNLRAAIEAELGKAAGEAITADDMATLIGLQVYDANISDLTGLEHAINLTFLNLENDELGPARDDNNISDLSPLAGLTNLTILTLAGNISDLSPLTGLTNLESLVLVGTSISDLSPLTGLINLTALGLDGNNISDISPLTGLTNLMVLGLSGNNISDISVLPDLTNLTELYLMGTSIPDLSPLADLTNLTALGLDGNNISDISVLSGLTNLRQLWLNDNSILGISPLAGLTNLTFLNLTGNNISDLSPLVDNTGLGNGDEVNVKGNPLSTASINTHLPALQSRGVTVEFDAPPVTLPDPNLRAAVETALDKAAGDTITEDEMETLTQFSARGRRVSDLTGLEFATNLTLTLNLRDNNISDISPLANLTNLKVLLLEGNNISDISPLSGLTNLETLDLGDNAISDISPLANLTNLKTLRLRNNVISDVAPLVELTNLAYLWLDGNAISDISAVAGLTNLTELYLAGNPIENASVLCPLTEQHPDLKVDIEIDCELAVSADTDLINLSLGAVKATALLQNYPNPFNPETWIPYLLADDAFVTLTIHDESGRLVRSFDVGDQRAGVYQRRSRAVYWDGRNESGEQVASGVYFYQLDAGDYSATRKMVILK